MAEAPEVAASAEAAPAAEAVSSLMYTVQSGDTLSKIAKQHYGKSSKYMVIFEANDDKVSELFVEIITKYTNGDADEYGDACDNCPGTDNAAQTNSDGDSLGDACDNCPNDDNTDQADLDGDNEGDACDPDIDGDGVNQGTGGNPCQGGETTGCDDNCPTVANLDQRISTTTETVERARLTHQRALVLEQLTRTILSRGGNGFAATVTADELQRLRDTVSSARRSRDKIAEMTAILRLNSAILDQSFTDLLTTVARDWIRFAPAADFEPTRSRLFRTGGRTSATTRFPDRRDSRSTRLGDTCSRYPGTGRGRSGGR